MPMLPRRAGVRIRPLWRCRQVAAARRLLSNTAQAETQPDVQSSTAIHPSPLESSPKRLALYNTLEKLRSISHAELHGRFDLALEDLREWQAPFRIAILGTGDAAKPGRLIRLLSLPKKDESEWAEKLSDPIQPGHGILITPGQDASYKQSSLTPMAEITLPHATKLLSSKFTMVVLNLDPSRGPFAALEPSIPLGPRKGNLYYPVHRSIMIVENLQGLIGGSMQSLLEPLNQDLRVVVTVDPQTIRAVGDNSNANIRQRLVSLDLAEAAISNDIKDVVAWSESKIEDTIPLLVPGDQTGSDAINGLSGHVYSHIRSLLDTPLEPLVQNPSIFQAEPTRRTSDLDAALETWSKAAAIELNRDLKTSTSSNTVNIDNLNSYGRLTWWNVPRHANNVNEICTTAIKNDFLTDAERQSCWFGGRLVGEGFTVQSLKASDFTLLRDMKPAPVTAVPAGTRTKPAVVPSSPSLITGVLQDTFSKNYIYPYHISQAKSYIISNLIPPLQIEAKRLRTNFDTNFLLSGATAILLELSEFSTYASLSVFSLGLVLAARRLQLGWEKATRKWEESVKEAGRVGVLDVQHWVKRVLESEKLPRVEEATKLEEQVRRREEVLELRIQAKAQLEKLKTK